MSQLGANWPFSCTHASIWSISLSTITVLAVVLFLGYAQAVFVPLVLAVLIAYPLDPIVTAITRLRIPRAWAAGLVITGVLAGVGFGAYTLRHHAMAVLDGLPEAARRIRALMQTGLTASNSLDPLDRISRAATEIEKAAAAAEGAKPAPQGVTKVQVEEPAFRAQQLLWTGSMGAAVLAGQVIVVIFLVYFLLASGDLYKRKLVKVFGKTIAGKRVTTDAINEIHSQIARFLLVLLGTNLIVGVATGIVLAILGVQHAAIWGIVAGVLNSIPYFGPVIVTVGLGLVGLLQFGTMAAALRIAFLALLITTLEGYLLTPIFMGRVSHISSLALLISLLFWSWLWGPIGTIVAVPLTMIIKITCERIQGLEPIGELLSEK